MFPEEMSAGGCLACRKTGCKNQDGGPRLLIKLKTAPGGSSEQESYGRRKIVRRSDANSHVQLPVSTRGNCSALRVEAHELSKKKELKTLEEKQEFSLSLQLGNL